MRRIIIHGRWYKVHFRDTTNDIVYTYSKIVVMSHESRLTAINITDDNIMFVIVRILTVYIYIA